MAKPFTLSLERVHCDHQTSGEWGSDEMYLVGFGISKGGTRFTIKPVSLGSFEAGDTSSSGYPKSLVDIRVSDDESLVSTCVWLFERDSGGLANAGSQLEADFNSVMDASLAASANLGLSPDARQYYAFAQTMHSQEFGLEADAEQGWNPDDLLDWYYHDHVQVVDPPNFSRAYDLFFNFDGGSYTLTFRYVLGPPVIIVP
jgi:hypothetical protein